MAFKTLVRCLTPILVFLFPVFCLIPPACADVIYYRTGGTLKGLIVEEHRDRVVVSTEEGEKPILRGDIDEVFYDDAERNYLYLGNEALALREFAMAKGLFRKALQIFPRFQEAEDALHRLEDLKLKEESGFKAHDPLEALHEQWGLNLSRQGQKWVVVQGAAEGLLAYRSGIASGDALVSFWGDSLAYLNVVEVAETLVGPPGSAVKLTLSREVSLPGDATPGITLSMQRLGLTVAAVGPLGRAGRTGLVPGDRIVAMDGKSTRYLPFSQARRILQEAGERGTVLLIHRDRMIRRE